MSVVTCMLVFGVSKYKKAIEIGALILNFRVGVIISIHHGTRKSVTIEIPR